MTPKEYYTHRSILFEIVKQLKQREVSFVQKGVHEKYTHYAIRQINAYSINVLLKNFNRFDFFNIPCNLYYSLAKYSFIPFASFNMDKRKEDYKKWSCEWKKYFLGMDFALDFDCKDLEVARQDVIRASSFLSSHRIPYTVAFSGSKGFHIEIPQEKIKGISVGDDEEWVIAYKCFVKFIKRKVKLRSLDDSIIDSRRIFKVKYSLDVSSGFVCLPLDDYQLANFCLDMVRPGGVLGLSGLGTRGLLLRNSGSVFDFYSFMSSIK